ncbi:hypothetical protein, partial [Pseudomonas sp. MF6768]|uniref:hypothetical protein n=1 Tax=Pseudomonas sp. MF6768 TaxID=2797532 RepID=UPI001E64786E
MAWDLLLLVVFRCGPWCGALPGRLPFFLFSPSSSSSSLLFFSLFFLLIIKKKKKKASYARSIATLQIIKSSTLRMTVSLRFL